MVLLVTSDNEQFVVDKEVAERSVLIKNMLEGKPLLPNLTSPDRDRLSRCRRERPAHSFAQRLFFSVEKGRLLSPRAAQKIAHFHARFSSTASIIAASLCQPPTIPIRTKLAREQLILANGIKNSSPLIKKCSSRSSSPPTI